MSNVGIKTELNTKNDNDTKEFLRLEFYNGGEKETHIETETSNLYQMHQIQVLLLIASKIPIIKFSYGIGVMNKSWKVSVLKELDGSGILIMKLFTQFSLQVTRSKFLQ